MSMVLGYTIRYIAVWLWKQLGEGQTIGLGTYQATPLLMAEIPLQRGHLKRSQQQGKYRIANKQTDQYM
jgi:hypothetical protein